jgi:hypothetical protein
MLLRFCRIVRLARLARLVGLIQYNTKINFEFVFVEIKMSRV